jgi:hypothetical protein
VRTALTPLFSIETVEGGGRPTRAGISGQRIELPAGRRAARKRRRIVASSSAALVLRLGVVVGRIVLRGLGFLPAIPDQSSISLLASCISESPRIGAKKASNFFQA